MKVVKTIPAGRPGTRRYLAEWGDKLLNVRYRIDDSGLSSFTTVEIVVDERPRVPVGRVQNGFLRTREKSLVYIYISYHEDRLRQRVRNVGATWDSARKLWRLPREKVVNMGLLDRIVPVQES